MAGGPCVSLGVSDRDCPASALFTEPVPVLIKLVETVDSFFRFEILTDVVRIGVPGVFMSGLVLLAAVIFLFFTTDRYSPGQIYFAAGGFFPLFLIFGIAFTGILMRYFTKMDIRGGKRAYDGSCYLSSDNSPGNRCGIFYVHLFFVSVLLAYFPFSKLMHMGGVFMSPTRNLTCNTRAVRHINPWNYPVEVHTYEEYEEEFREKMIEAGLPVEKE